MTDNHSVKKAFNFNADPDPAEKWIRIIEPSRERIVNDPGLVLRKNAPRLSSKI